MRVNYLSNADVEESRKNVTVIEENLVCKLTKRRKSTTSQPVFREDKENIVYISSDSENSKSHDANVHQITIKYNIEPTSHLDIVNKYDLDCNFIPQPGSSRMNNTALIEKPETIPSPLISPSTSIDNLTLTPKSFLWTPVIKPPTRKDILMLNLPKVINEKPFYSNVKDVTGSVEIGKTLLKLSSRSSIDYPSFDTVYGGLDNHRKLRLQNLYPDLKLTKKQLLDLKLRHCNCKTILITPLKRPPTRKQTEEWFNKQNERKEEVNVIREKKRKILIPSSPGMDMGDDEDDSSLTLTPATPIEDRDRTLSEAVNNTPKSSRDNLSNTPKSTRDNVRKYVLEKTRNSCAISGATLSNSNTFNQSILNYKNEAISHHQHLTILIMELHVETRGDYKPNPELDGIKAIFYKIINDVPTNEDKIRVINGIVCIKKNLDYCIYNENYQVKYAENELEMFNEFINLIYEWDPDIFIGYEIEMASWGYLIERGYILNINLMQKLSRIPDEHLKRSEELELKLTGRILLDFWRLLRHEIALQSYTIENVVYHLLHQRIPKFSHKSLTYWWEHASNVYIFKVLNYYVIRLEFISKIINHLDLIGRTCELARLFGIQFYEVLSRGSQFRVESMMLRLAKPKNYIPVSPNVQQKAKMCAPESIPLILEPESKFYEDPLIVLDFQSLYPSMIIAYNFCFTTCLGKVSRLGKNVPFEFGATHLKVKRKIVKKLLDEDQLNFSPCGVAFVKSELRRGILPQMLEEILSTRLMVKKSMKRTDDKSLKRILHSRQLGLKLIANVTYGYTAANFSGRMAAVEVADSVVSKGRETLERAINLIENTPEWGSKVVYGDTDSLFVLVPGKTRKDAFIIGEKIANAVTDDNPSPVKLKLEKIYQPCILQTKKRYVGYMYESPDQKLPVYDAKGIETVRRDGCPAVAKMLEKSLKILFDTKDVSLVKKYVVRQFCKIISGRVSIQDLTFAREYRGSAGYRPGACVPALELIKKWKAIDKRNEPRSKERVPYIIVNGPPGLPLIRLVRSPYELLEDPSLRPNALYYITKVIIPAINRCFTLLGADLNGWFNEMPRKHIQYLPTSSPDKQHKRSTISQYFSLITCASCGEQTHEGLCLSCLRKPQVTMVILQDKIRRWEQKHFDINTICHACIGDFDDICCISLDCPIYYQSNKANRDVQQADYCRNLIESLP